MIEYRRQYECYSEPAEVGDGTEPVFEYNSDGELYCTGRQNVQEIIQSHEEECDLAYIMSRALNGDPTALNSRLGQYIDTVGMPETYSEAFEMGAVAQRANKILSHEDIELLQKDPEAFAKQYAAKSADQEKADLLARLQQLTGKEVKIDE